MSLTWLLIGCGWVTYSSLWAFDNSYTQSLKLWHYWHSMIVSSLRNWEPFAGRRKSVLTAAEVWADNRYFPWYTPVLYSSCTLNRHSYTKRVSQDLRRTLRCIEYQGKLGVKTSNSIRNSSETQLLLYYMIFHCKHLSWCARMHTNRRLLPTLVVFQTKRKGNSWESGRYLFPCNRLLWAVESCSNLKHEKSVRQLKHPRCNSKISVSISKPLFSLLFNTIHESSYLSFLVASFFFSGIYSSLLVVVSFSHSSFGIDRLWEFSLSWPLSLNFLFYLTLCDSLQRRQAFFLSLPRSSIEDWV